MRREGMAKQRDKLKELKHEGHIALGKWNSQWSHMKPYVGWALLSAPVTCLQGSIRWEPFVIETQPVDTSLLGVCWHNKLLPANLPQRFLSQLANSRSSTTHTQNYVSWDVDMAEWVECLLSMSKVLGLILSTTKKKNLCFIKILNTRHDRTCL
jgi:hypothetical protein